MNLDKLFDKLSNAHALPEESAVGPGGVVYFSPHVLLKVLAAVDLAQLEPGLTRERVRVFQQRAAPALAAERVKANPRPAGEVLYDLFKIGEMDEETWTETLFASLDPDTGTEAWRPKARDLESEYVAALLHTAAGAIRRASAAGRAGSVVAMLDTSDHLANSLRADFAPLSPTRQEIKKGRRRFVVVSVLFDRLDAILRPTGAVDLMDALATMPEIRVFVVCNGAAGAHRIDP